MRKGNLSKRATSVLETAYRLATQYGDCQTSPAHLLLALLYAPDTAAGRILAQNGLLFSLAEPVLLNSGEKKQHRNTKNVISVDLRRIIRSAAAEAATENRVVTPEQLLMSLLRDKEGRSLIKRCGAEPDCVFTGLVTVFREPEPRIQEKRETALKLTEQFARDLAEKAALGDPVIGRSQELDELIRILCRKNKNNPALIGEPGVGKTAIVEELARRIAGGRVPEQLAGKRLLSLDMASLVAGTKYRGEFEERVRDLLAEIRRAGNLILFVDEMHTLIGAGSAEGAIDAANIIKPALGRGELQMIGATTRKEYRKYIEKDAALERRFRVVQIEEPTRAQTLDILRGLRPGLELHHRVHIGDEALEAAVSLSERYLHERFLPDKALDLLDESAASAVMQQPDKQKMRIVTRQTVAETIALRTGIPAGRISSSEREELLHLEEKLRESIVGQDEAVRLVAAAVRRGRSGLAESSRPVAAILLAGPTGVGKTALCKALACEVYGSEQAMIRLDMSEYMERHTVSRLLGAPPGYVGHGEGGELTEKVRRKPYSLLLLDELEKAHRDVTAVLLQIMEDGVLTDAVGRTVSFRNTLIVMTTNAGSTLESKTALGFASEQSSQLMKHLREYFAPEFLSRIDAIAAFHPLQEPQLCRIADRLLHQTVERAQAAGVALCVDASAAVCIGSRCSRLPGGAREIRHMVQSMVENPLADMILTDATPLHAQLVCRNGELQVLRSSALTV